MRTGFFLIFIIVFGFVSFVPNALYAEKVVELKMSHFMPSIHVQHVEVMVPFSQEVEKATNGRVKITVYPGGSLVKAPDHYDAAATGIVDFAYVVHGYTPGKFPLTSVMELPFLFNSAVQGTKVFYDLWEKFPEFEKEHPNVKVCWIWAGDTGQLFTTKKQVRAMEDLKGLKIRTHSLVLKNTLEKLGAVPVTLPISELFESLQKGVIDGCITPWSAVYDFGLHNVVRYATVANFYVPSFVMVMNKNSFQKLSIEDQKILSQMMGKKMGLKAAMVYDNAAQKGIDSLKKSGGTIYSLPENELNRWRKAVEEVYTTWVKDMENKRLPGKKVFEEAKSLSNKYSK